METVMQLSCANLSVAGGGYKVLAAYRACWQDCKILQQPAVSSTLSYDEGERLGQNKTRKYMKPHDAEGVGWHPSKGRSERGSQYLLLLLRPERRAISRVERLHAGLGRGKAS